MIFQLAIKITLPSTISSSPGDICNRWGQTRKGAWGSVGNSLYERGNSRSNKSPTWESVMASGVLQGAEPLTPVLWLNVLWLLSQASQEGTKSQPARTFWIHSRCNFKNYFRTILFFPHPNNLNPSLLSTSQSLSLHLHKIPQMFISLTLKKVERCKYSWHLSDGSLEQSKWQQLSFLVQGRGVKQLLAHNTEAQPWNHGFLIQPDHMVKTEGTNSV